ncbi:MAG: tRNA pseudouridine(38-40) synthase TruA [Clostridiales bacterium]|nr:tRNA pseudouridine(38-40) synthase TruA [Clostridiales bacterium]
MRYKGICEYDGTDYGGWQRQKNANTVQEEIEKALTKLLETPITIHGAGRTDAGVHARGQVFHFDGDTRIPPDKLAYAVNYLLPKDIRLKQTQAVGEDFHCRFDAKAKWYRYQIYNHPFASPLRGRYSWYVPFAPLDVDLMKEAVKPIVGTHDYAAFAASGSYVEMTVRTIYKAEISIIDGLITLDIVGSGFLYNMVRIIAGTLVDIGRGKLNKDTFTTMLQTLDRKQGGMTAPPNGLCMMRVYYDGEDVLSQQEI